MHLQRYMDFIGYITELLVIVGLYSVHSFSIGLNYSFTLSGTNGVYQSSAPLPLWTYISSSEPEPLIRKLSKKSSRGKPMSREWGLNPMHFCHEFPFLSVTKSYHLYKKASSLIVASLWWCMLICWPVIPAFFLHSFPRVSFGLWASCLHH